MNSLQTRGMKNIFLKTILFVSSLLMFTTTGYANINGADTQNFNPSYSGRDFVTLHSTKILPRTLNVGIFGDYSKGTLPAYDRVTKLKLGDTAVYAHFHAGLGVTEWLEFGVDLPFIIQQEITEGPLQGRFSDLGLTELKYSVKLRLLEIEGGGGVAAVLSLGENRIKFNPFIGDDPGKTINIELAADKELGKMRVGANLGYRLREPGTAPFYTPIGGGANQPSLIEPYGNIILASAGLLYHLKPNVDIAVELYGSLPDAEKIIYRQPMAVEALVGAVYRIDEAWNFHAGLTKGINHGTSTPDDFRVYAGVNHIFKPFWGNLGLGKKKAKVEAPKVDMFDVDLPNEPMKIDMNAAPDAIISYYNKGYRMGYNAGKGLNDYTGKGPYQGRTILDCKDLLDCPEGFYDGYFDGEQDFPGPDRKLYADCYKIGFNGKMGEGPASGTSRDWVNSTSWTPILDQTDSECIQGYHDGWDDARPPVNVAVPQMPDPFEIKTPVIQTPIIEAPSFEPDLNVGTFIDESSSFGDCSGTGTERFVLQAVLFELNSTRLTRQVDDLLNKLVDYLLCDGKANFNKVIVEGHTDVRGSAAYNKNLSKGRANSVKNAIATKLRARGASSHVNKLMTEAWGETRPLYNYEKDSDYSEKEHQDCRRVEFVIYR